MSIFRLDVLTRCCGLVLAGLLFPGVALAADVDTALRNQANIIFKPLPKDMSYGQAISAAQIALGRSLFFDVRLSADNSISCAGCHQPSRYGVDGQSIASSAAGTVNPRNTQTVLNAALDNLIGLHWRGDRKSVEDQASHSMTGEMSFAMPNEQAVIEKLAGIPSYPSLFSGAFPGETSPINLKNIGIAIGAFERTLVTPSAFDRFLGGDDKALSAQAKTGLKTFIEQGCAGCHNGASVGGSIFRKFGLVKDYWTLTGSQNPDKGRFELTKNPMDMYVFRVAPLRNVAMTAPYFHDGSVTKLADAIRIMGETQLGISLNDAQVRSMEVFLTSLTGALPENFSIPPAVVAAQPYQKIAGAQ